MNKSTHYLAFALSVCCFLFSLESAANNISVSSVSLTARNKTADYVQVQFNLSWNNSFRVNTGPSNWDAAWVFIKFKVGVNGEWKHASVSTTGGHSIPSGATASQADTKGLFIYRDANGTGNLSLTGVQLRWNYGTDGVGDEEKIYVKVFAVEMVLVPQGDFQVGSGGQNTGEFRRANDVSSSSTATTFTITSSAPTFQGNNSSSSAANLSTRLGAGNDLSTGTTTATLGAGYPTGYAAFYCMKYEISQGQYRDFLNTLTYTQQVTRTASAPNSAVGTGALISSGTARNGIEIKTASTSSTTPAVYGCDLSNNNTFDEAADGEWIACNYLSWGDIAAYLDWAALRPMTELEYEKACRGNLPPVVNEYAWGVASATNVSSLLNTSQSTEASNTSGANLVSNSAFSTGPVKVGIFATGSSTRIQAGSGYYGIMELSGNVWEQTVPISTANARSFSNVMGDGTLATDGNAVVTTWPVSSDVGIRGGSYTSAGALNYVSDRTSISAGVIARNNNVGGRGVRAAPTIFLSANGTAEVSAYTCTTASVGTLIVGTPVSGVTQTITANVTTVGTYNISTTANGVTFAASGTFAGTGAQNTMLTANGTPTAAGSNTFTLNTTPNCSFSRTTLVNPSSNGTAVVSFYTCSTASAGTMTAGSAVSGVTQTITATVSTVGTYIITATANGVTFAANGTFASTGPQNIVLIATGTPTAAGCNTFTLNTTPNCNFSRSTSLVITGGTVTDITVSGINYRVHTFTSSGTLTVSGCSIVEFLLVAGGGGGRGGGTTGGGGGGAGAGGVVESTALLGAATFTVTVGSGGTGGAVAGFGTVGNPSSIAGSGLTTITALGGGNPRANHTPAVGGSGAGGFGRNQAGEVGLQPTSASGGFGNNGGSGNGNASPAVNGGGGGGGGAGSVGLSGSTRDDGGNGGSGRTSSISGSSVGYAGGGGGGSNSTGTAGTATDGGGGGGASGESGSAGAANTGGGGGGGAAGQAGGNGGSGIVIIRYRL